MKNNEKSIKAYDAWHAKFWPQVIHNMIASGIKEMQIYRVNTRLFMIIDVIDTFSFEKKSTAELPNKKVQEWNALMLQFQEPLSYAKPGEKWVVMDKIFDLNQ